MARNKLPRTANDPVMALSLDEIYDGTVAEMFDSLNENFETIGAEGAIKANSLDSNAVTTAKIADHNVTTAKLDLSDLSGSTDFKNMLVNLVYPIGSYYWSSNNISPQSFLGGIWTQVKDRFVLAAGDKFKKDYQPVYTGDNEGNLYPVSFSSFRVGDENMDGGVFSFSSKGGYISRQKDWSPTFAYRYNNKTYVSIALSWYRLYENQQSNRIELIGLRDDGVTWEALGLSSNLYIYMSDGSVYTITPNMLSNGPLYPDQTTNNYGGEETVYLAISDLAKHRHNIIKWGFGSDIYNNSTKIASALYDGSTLENDNAATAYSEYTGGSQPHNNMPPYEIAYCWKRTA